MAVRACLIVRLLVLALVCQWLPTPTGAVAADGGERWALLIGVNRYQQIEPLSYCARDMQALRDQLVGSGFREDHVFLLCDDAKDAKYLPFKRNIERQLELFLSLISKNDLVVVAFSGHGVHLDGTSYLCPFEAQLDDPQATMVSQSLVYEKLTQCPAALRLMIVDACRNDPRLGANKALGPNKATTQFAQSIKRPPEGVLLLTSCAEGEVSKEETEFEHGVFVHFLLEGLRGKADVDNDQAISLGELARYAGRETKTYVARRFNDFQSPSLEGKLALDVLDFRLALANDLSASPTALPQTAPAPHEVTNSIGMKLVYVPAGEFMMGSPEIEAGHSYDEVQRQVKIARPFYMGVFEVTQAEYERVMGTNPSWYSSAADSGTRDVKDLDTSRFPVENVSWDDAVVFCRKLSELPSERAAGRVYRLPTEAEWEFACRGGTTTPFNLGAGLSPRTANCSGGDPYVVSVDGPGLGRPTTVGAYKAPNSLGLHDMHANVHEWCSDWYDAAHDGKPDFDPPQRALRGGDYGDTPSGCRSASRTYREPDTRISFIGFRVALER